MPLFCGNTRLCLHWQWNTLEFCPLDALQVVVFPLSMKHTRVVSLNARQAKPGVQLVDTTRVCFIVNEHTFYHDMQISWPDSGSPPIRFLIVPEPTTVELPHASGHFSGNRQGHVTKTRTHRFEIFVAFKFVNMQFLLDSWHHLSVFS